MRLRYVGVKGMIQALVTAALLVSVECAGAPVVEAGHPIWPSDLLIKQAHLRKNFAYTLEEVETVGNGPYRGVNRSRVPPPPPNLTIGGLVTFLRLHLPNFAVWRAAVGGRVIHVAERRALEWKHNPLNTKFTFHGTVSIEYLESHIFTKMFPQVRFYNLPWVRTNVSPGFPDARPFQSRLHFNVAGMTLRRFLTAGIVYRFGPNHFNGQLWKAFISQKSDGKFTGHVDIFITATPVMHPAPNKPKAKGK